MLNGSLVAQELPPPIPPRTWKKKTPRLINANSARSVNEIKFCGLKSRDKLLRENVSRLQIARKEERNSVKLPGNYSLAVRSEKSNLSRYSFIARDRTIPKECQNDISNVRRFNSLQRTKENDDIRPCFSRSYQSRAEVPKMEMFSSVCQTHIQEEASVKCTDLNLRSDALDKETVLIETQQVAEKWLPLRLANRRNAICFEIHKELRGAKLQTKLIQIYRDR